MSDTIVVDGEVSLTSVVDGVVGTVIEVGHDTGIDTIVFNNDYTLTFNMTNGDTFTTGSIRGAQGETGATGADGTDGVGIASTVLNADYTLTITLTDGTEYTTGSIRGEQGEAGSDAEATDVQINGTSITSNHVANIPIVTTSTAGVMSATDKTNLDAVVADYSSALTALGVIE